MLSEPDGSAAFLAGERIGWSGFYKGALAGMPVHPRRSDIVLALMAAGVILVLLSFADAALRRTALEPALRARAELAQRLGLTDLALFTEARYARHPSQADLHSAFQDHPLALEHFPSGSLVPPPRFKASGP